MIQDEDLEDNTNRVNSDLNETKNGIFHPKFIEKSFEKLVPYEAFF